MSPRAAAPPLPRAPQQPPRHLPEPAAASEQGFTVRQAAEITGLSEHTLRYYERARLLQPVRRQDSSRHRRYSAEDIARLRTLACLRATGMPLDQMRQYFELIAQGQTAAPLQHAMLLAQRRVLEDRLKELQGHLEYLDRKIDYWGAVQAGDDRRASEILEEMFTRLARQA